VCLVSKWEERRSKEAYSVLAIGLRAARSTQALTRFLRQPSEAIGPSFEGCILSQTHFLPNLAQFTGILGPKITDTLNIMVVLAITPDTIDKSPPRRSQVLIALPHGCCRCQTEALRGPCRNKRGWCRGLGYVRAFLRLRAEDVVVNWSEGGSFPGECQRNTARSVQSEGFEAASASFRPPTYGQEIR